MEKDKGAPVFLRTEWSHTEKREVDFLVALPRMEFWVVPSHTICITELHTLPRLHLKFKHLDGDKESLRGKGNTSPEVVRKRCTFFVFLLYVLLLLLD